MALDNQNTAQISNSRFILIAAGFLAIILLTAFAEHHMGRSLFGPDGRFGLWEGAVNSVKNSQRLIDPYSFTHFSHGLIFYAVIWFFARKLPAGYRFLAAAALEASWEILENSSLIIERYRAATVSLGYFGDSILNSAGDILSMAAGFWCASKLPPKASIAAFIMLEILLLITIKDNLALNVIMLVYPLQFIKNWQLSM